MAALTGTLGIRPTLRNPGREYDELLIGVAFRAFLGGYYAVVAATGDLGLPADAAGIVPKGLLLNFGEGAEDASGAIQESVVGLAGSATVIRPRARLEVGGFVILDVPVGGAVSADQTDVGTEVFLYTDNILADITITVGGTDTRAKGVIVEFLTTGRYVVRFYSANVIAAK